MTRLIVALIALCLGGVASAQTPPAIGESAKAVLGTWEFSNADRDKICTANFKTDRTGTIMLRKMTLPARPLIAKGRG